MATPHQFASDDGDFYAILHVPTGADEDAIRQSYRNLARLYHPDVAGEQDEEMMKRLNAAYHTLSDPARRREYDLRHGIHARAMPAPRPEAQPFPAPPAPRAPFPRPPQPSPRPQPVRQTRSEGGPLRWYRTIDGLEGPINAIAFAQGGDIAGVGTSDGHIEIWKLNAQQRIATLKPRALHALRPGVLRELRLSPQGTLAMAWGLYFGVHCWHVATRATLWHSAASAPAGMMDSILFDAPSLARIALPAAPLAEADEDPFHWASLGGHGTNIMTRPLEQQGAVSPLWAVPLHCEEPQLPGARRPQIHLRVLSWDGDLLLTFASGPVSPTVSNASILRLWGLRIQGRVGASHPQPLGQVIIPARALRYPVAVSALGFIVAIHLDDRVMRLYDVRTGSHIDLPTGDLPRETLAALSPDGALLALAPPDGSHVDLWATASGQRIQTWDLPSPVAALRFAQPGNLPTLAIGRVDGTCEVWTAG